MHDLSEICDHEHSQHILSVLKQLQVEGTVPGNDWLAPLLWRREPGWKNAAIWEAKYRQAAVIVHVRFRIIDVGDSN